MAISIVVWSCRYDYSRIDRPPNVICRQTDSGYIRYPLWLSVSVSGVKVIRSDHTHSDTSGDLSKSPLRKMFSVKASDSPPILL